jgi:hypothetical protein
LGISGGFFYSGGNFGSDIDEQVVGNEAETAADKVFSGEDKQNA